MPVLDAAACAELIEALTGVAVRAAFAIRAAAGKAGVRRKRDGSPVTTADIAAQESIRAGLARVAPELPIISEEETEHAPSPADCSYFLVDPLDGTREFIAGRDEYAVSIAAMSGGTPILGVIAAPALGLIWSGILGRGAQRAAFTADGRILPASPVRTRSRPQGEIVVLVSRSHLDGHTQAYLAGLEKPRTVPCGSAIKFCRVAEGSADLYPRLAPTRDWDVAAGHAIVTAAGGRVLAPDGSPLRYGTADLRIPAFVAAGEAHER